MGMEKKFCLDRLVTVNDAILAWKAFIALGDDPNGVVSLSGRIVPGWLEVELYHLCPSYLVAVSFGNGGHRLHLLNGDKVVEQLTGDDLRVIAIERHHGDLPEVTVYLAPPKKRSA